MTTFTDIPDTLATNDTVTLLLTAAAILGTVSTARLWPYISRQTRHFFYQPKSSKVFSQTQAEAHYQLFLLLFTCLNMTLTAALATEHYETQGLLTLFLAFTTTLTLKITLYQLTGWTFFEKNRNRDWLSAIVFLTAIEGVALFPLVLIQIYHAMPTHSFLTAVAAVVVTVKALTMMKAWNIHFAARQQLATAIIYFGAFETVPLLSLVAIIARTAATQG